MPPEPAENSCERHTQCRPLGKKALCGRGGVCVEATTDDCGVIQGPLGEDDVFVIGSISKRLNEGDSGFGVQDSVGMAIKEINALGGVAGKYPVVHVGCNSAGNSDVALKSARHLTEVLGVQAIIGPGRSDAFIEVSNQITSGAGVMLISPSATSLVITGLKDQDLSWRTAGNDRHQGLAIADLLLQRKLTRVSLLAFDDVYALALRDGVRSRFTQAIGKEDAVVTEIYQDPSKNDLNPALKKLALAMPKPEVVVVLGHEEVAQVIKAHHAANTGKPAHYIVSEDARKQAILELVKAFPELAERIDGVENNHRNGAVFEAFAARFEAAYGRKPPTHSPNAYDAAYLLAYAATASGEKNPTGARLARSMASLMPEGCAAPECRIEAGGADFSRAIARLNKGEHIDLDGASGDLNFNMKTGDVTIDVGLWSVTKAKPEEFTRSGMYMMDAKDEGSWVFENNTKPK